MKKIKLEIIGLSYSQTQTGAYAIVLGEAKGKRRLPIIIGGFEAQAIAIELEKMKPSRPLTHDLFKSFADSFKLSIREVIIYNLLDGIFYAKIVADNGTHTAEVDSRTSDAIALAVRFKCPIYTYEFILSSAGIVIEDEEKEGIKQSKTKATFKEPVHTPKNDFSKLPVKELKKLLQKAIEDEAYEEASLIRDEINRRK